MSCRNVKLESITGTLIKKKKDVREGMCSGGKGADIFYLFIFYFAECAIDMPIVLISVSESAFIL